METEKNKNPQTSALEEFQKEEGRQVHSHSPSVSRVPGNLKTHNCAYKQALILFLLLHSPWV